MLIPGLLDLLIGYIPAGSLVLLLVYFVLLVIRVLSVGILMLPVIA